MKIKSMPAGRRIKAGPDDGLKEGEFIVYPSTFTREPDSYGDVVAKGAFLDGIKAWVDSGDAMPAMYMHDPKEIVGNALEMGEDDHGWWVKGEFDLEDAQASKRYRDLKGRRIGSLSFAYKTLEEGAVELEDGRKANELRKVMPIEFSFLPKFFAANDDTSVVAVKAAADLLLADVKAGRVISAANESEIKSAIDDISAAAKRLKELLPAESGGNTDEGKASGEPAAKSDASDEEPPGAKSSVSDEEPKASPSVERLSAQAHIYALSGQEGILS